MTPFEHPEVFNAPVVDGAAMRGLWKIASGAERVTPVQQVQSPQYAGAYSIVRIEEMVSIEYRVEVITLDDYRWLQAMLAVFRQGQKLRPPKGPRTYKLEDPTIAHLDVRLVTVSKLTKIEHLGKGKHATTIGLSEWKKKVPFGGPPAARPKSEVEQEIERMNSENKALEQQLAAMKKK